MAKGTKVTVGKKGFNLPQIEGFPGSARTQEFLKRVDGWTNFYTGIRVPGADRRLATTYGTKQVLHENILRNLYGGDGLAKKIIEKPVQMMTRGDFTIKGDPEGMVKARLQETGIFNARRDLLRWARLYGGALGVVGLDDGQKYDIPLNTGRLRNIHYMHVFNRWRVTFTTADLYSDSSNPKFGQPEFYRVSPIFGTPFRVHESRTIRMDGAPVDDLARWQNQGWGDSILQACFDELRQVGAVFDSSESIVEDFVQATIKIKNLATMIGQGEEAKAIKRLELIDKGRHVINATLLDADLESYEKISSSVAGLADLLDRHCNKLSAVGRMPATVLFGEAPAGLNSTGDSDVRNWYDDLSADRAEQLGPIDEKLSKWVFQSQDYYFDGKEPDSWEVEYAPLWQPSAKELEDIKKTKGDRIVAFVQQSILDPREVRAMPEIRDEFGITEDMPPPADPGTDPEPEPGDDKEPVVPQGEEPAQAEAKDWDCPDSPDLGYHSIVTSARRLLRDTKGRMRGDRERFVPEVVVLSKERFKTTEDARKWAADFGFVNLAAEETLSTIRLVQRDSKDSLPETRRNVSPEDGVEIVLTRIKVGR